MTARKRRPERFENAVADGSPLPTGRLDDPGDVDALRAAIELKAARPAADLPSAEFVADLRRHVSDPVEGRGVSRRAVLTGAAVAAAAAVAGAVADRTVLAPGPSAPGQSTIEPDRGAWVRVASPADLADGSPQRFETATATGFVSQHAGELVAVSGACTHQGCLLQADARAGRLDCPCHRTAFGYDGRLPFSQLHDQPSPLPRLAVRTDGAGIEVFLPETTA